MKPTKRTYVFFQGYIIGTRGVVAESLEQAIDKLGKKLSETWEAVEFIHKGKRIFGSREACDEWIEEDIIKDWLEYAHPDELLQPIEFMRGSQKKKLIPNFLGQNPQA